MYLHFTTKFSCRENTNTYYLWLGHWDFNPIFHFIFEKIVFWLLSTWTIDFPFHFLITKHLLNSYFINLHLILISKILVDHILLLLLLKLELHVFLLQIMRIILSLDLISFTLMAKLDNIDTLIQLFQIRVSTKQIDSFEGRENCKCDESFGWERVIYPFVHNKW